MHLSFKITKYDVTIINSIFQFYNYIGMFSLTAKYTKAILILYYVIGTVCVIKSHFLILLLMPVSSTGLVLSSLGVVMMTLFALVCLKDVCCYNGYWIAFFRDIKSFDRKMKGQRSILEEFLWKNLSKLILGHVVFVTFNYYSYSSTLESLESIISFSYICIISFQLLATTLVISIILEMLKKRFELLSRKTMEVYLTPTRGDTFWNDVQLMDSHLLLINITGTINNLFGHRILLSIMLIFVNVLGGFQYGVLEDVLQTFGNYALIFSIETQMVISWVSVTFT